MSPSPAAGTPTAGRRFILLRTLGEGTFGTVYLADMESAGGFRRRVALKLLNPSWDPESDAGRRLRDEARLLGRLQHRNIVRVDDLVRVSGRWAMVMEYVAGSDLETVFTNARAAGQELPPRAVLQIGQAVAAALRAAWEAPGDGGQPLRVIHRDIKPSNIRLSESGDVKVLDFGVARAQFAEREARTERVRYGSLGYMAPERVLGEPESPAGDVYALGVVLWELLLLETLGRAGTTPKAHRELVERMERELRPRAEGPLGALVPLLVRSLGWDPAGRPTAAELERELRTLALAAPGEDLGHFAAERLLALGDPTPTHPDPVEGTVVEEATGPQPHPARPAPTLVLEDDPVEVLPAPPSSRRRLGIGMAAAVLLVVGAASWLALGRGTPDRPPAAAAVEAPSPGPEGAPAPEAAPPTPPTAAAVLPVTPTTTAEPPPSAPSRPAPRPVAAPTPTTAPTPTSTPTAQEPESAVATGSRLRAAKFSLTGGEGIEVRCGDVSASGATNVVVREFPAGSCTVRAGGRSTTVTVDVPRGVRCTLAPDELQCQ